MAAILNAVQRTLLFVFLGLSGLTVVLQMRYGMLCGRSEQEDRQNDPAALACRRQTVQAAVGAVVVLVCCILLGVIRKKLIG